MRLPLGVFPTPLDTVSFEGRELFLKRDDLSSSLYGGNKVRKLGYLLAAARNQGATRLVTVGAAGSHHVLATALFGRAHHFDVDAILVPQPRTDHALETLGATLDAGANVFPAGGPLSVPWALAKRLGAAPWLRRGSVYVIPTGGSSALGSRGYVDAAAEITGVPCDDVVVALGSGGTAAGLAVGAVLAGLSCKVHGVVVADPKWLVPRLTRRLIDQVALLVDGKSRTLAQEAQQRLIVVPSELGRGYGFATPRGDAAKEVGASLGLALDSTYTAKAFAYALERLRSGRRVLYWHTLSAQTAATEIGKDPSVTREVLRRFPRLFPE